MLTFKQIMERRKQGAYYRWAEVNADDTTAAHRLSAGSFVDIWTKPKFTIDRNAKVFTIGSCFARNVEEKLEDNGVEVLSRDFVLDVEDYNVPARPNAALNKFNTQSIEDEIAMVLADKEYDPNEIFIEIDGKYFDPLASYTKIADLERVKSIREKIILVTSKIEEAGVVVITLGQNEAWVDLETRLHLNTAPPPSLLKRYKDRFGVELMNYEENMECLCNIMEMIKSKCSRDVKVIVTVSPVPMGTTLSNMDVISANVYSKSMLRICAQELMERYDFVDYFPSYEMATSSPRTLAWERDLLHVTDEAVGFITGQFIDRYLLPE